MGLFDKVKKATGLGLTPTEHYDRAFEKGVLLGPENFTAAIGMFEKAATKAEEAGESDIAQRARANAALYQFVTSGDMGALSTLQTAMQGLTEIEQVGSRQDMMPTAPLDGEITARLVEAHADQTDSTDHINSSAAHNRAAGAFKPIFNQELFTYQYHGSGLHLGHAKDRFFYHSGMAAWHDAVNAASLNPETAAEHMGKALNLFKQCSDEPWASRSQDWLQKCRLKRTCWVCSREFQGEGIHYNHYSATIPPYVTQVVQNLGQDETMLDAPNERLVLCSTCGSVVERIADNYATMRMDELRNELIPVIETLTGRIAQNEANIQTLASRLSRVESSAHRH